MEYKNPPVLKHMNFTLSEIEKARLNNHLLLIDIHMSNQCNLHCPGCYRDAGKSLNEELTFDECKNVLQQVAGTPYTRHGFYEIIPAYEQQQNQPSRG